MKEEEKHYDKKHTCIFKIDKELWERFLHTLPLSISASEKIRKMIFNEVIEHENILLKRSRLEISGENHEDTEK